MAKSASRFCRDQFKLFDFYLFNYFFTVFWNGELEYTIFKYGIDFIQICIFRQLIALFKLGVTVFTFFLGFCLFFAFSSNNDSVCSSFEFYIFFLDPRHINADKISFVGLFHR